MRNRYDENRLLNIGDDVKGTVTETRPKGVFIQLDTGDRAFAYFGGRIGERVGCSVKRYEMPGREMLVSVDKLLYDHMAA